MSCSEYDFFFWVKEGDVHAQEQMLERQSNLISAAASRNIYKLIWGGS